MEGNRVYKIMIVNLIFVIFDSWKALRKQKNKKNVLMKNVLLRLISL